ncbi:MAG: hypothetical protein HC834_04525 [Rhodospirillales bacterium]|nr:hypothetical protein [Rhodospirillales bacterium]
MLAAYGQTSPSTVISTQITGFINRAYAEVCRTMQSAPWNRRLFSVITTPEATGEATAAEGVTVTGGSRTVTFGASSPVDRRLIGALLQVATDDESYVIVDVTAATTAIIEPAYTGAALGTALSDQAWRLLGFNYRLPPDCTTPFVVKQSQSPVKLSAAFPRTADAFLPDPIILGQTGLPYIYAVTFGLGFPDLWGSLIQTQLGGSSGNMNVTNGSTAVAGGSTSPDLVNAVIAPAATAATSILPGMFIRFGGDSRYYQIRSVTSGTALVLSEPYRGTTATNLSYRIMPGDSPWIRFYPLPDTRMQVDTEYFAAPPPMQSDEEEPRLPQDLHGVVLDGALLNLYRYLTNESMSQFYENQFGAGLARIRMRSELSDESVFRYAPTYGTGSPYYGDGFLPYGMLPPSVPT